VNEIQEEVIYISLFYTYIGLRIVEERNSMKALRKKNVKKKKKHLEKVGYQQEK